MAIELEERREAGIGSRFKSLALVDGMRDNRWSGGGEPPEGTKEPGPP